MKFEDRQTSELPRQPDWNASWDFADSVDVSGVGVVHTERSSEFVDYSTLEQCARSIGGIGEEVAQLRIVATGELPMSTEEHGKVA